MRRLLIRIRETRVGRASLRIGVGVLGAILIAFGIVLLAFPGPGWLVIFAGMAVWSLEFAWARRLREYAQARVSAWNAWFASQRWPVRMLVAIATIVFLAAVALLGLRITFGPGVIGKIFSVVGSVR